MRPVFPCIMMSYPALQGILTNADVEFVQAFTIKNIYIWHRKTKKGKLNELPLRWSHLGSNQGPPDYESGALTS